MIISLVVTEGIPTSARLCRGQAFLLALVCAVLLLDHEEAASIPRGTTGETCGYQVREAIANTAVSRTPETRETAGVFIYEFVKFENRVLNCRNDFKYLIKNGKIFT